MTTTINLFTHKYTIQNGKRVLLVCLCGWVVCACTVTLKYRQRCTRTEHSVWKYEYLSSTIFYLSPYPYSHEPSWPYAINLLELNSTQNKMWIEKDKRSHMQCTLNRQRHTQTRTPRTPHQLTRIVHSTNSNRERTRRFQNATDNERALSTDLDRFCSKGELTWVQLFEMLEWGEWGSHNAVQ